MKDLKIISNEARKKIMNMKYRSKSSHIGAAFSVLDILVYSYFKGLNITKENLDDNNRDRLILSKGHASAAIYTTLSLRGFLEEEKLEKYSLGHGLSVATGMALAMRIDKVNNRIVVIMGDGEIDEGSVWEAAMFISKENLKNILIFIDCNGLQGYDRTEDILKFEKIKNMWKALEFEVIEINGHNFEEIEKAYKYKSDRPIVVLAKTIKGKGVSFMEDKLEWHYKSPNLEELKAGLKELEEEIK